MAKRNKSESNTESLNNAEDLKYKVGKGSIAYKPKGYSLSKIITVGEIIPDEVIENYKRQKILDALIKRGTIVLCGTDLKEVEVGAFKFTPIMTPGHSSDSVTFYFKEDKIMFVGDFIFKDTVGRCDLPTGSSSEMDKSIEKIKAYDDDITLYPGHGDETTLGREKEYNLYFIGK